MENTNTLKNRVNQLISTLIELEMKYWEADEYSDAVQDLKKVQKMLEEEPKTDLCKKIVENHAFSLDDRHYFWEKLAGLYYHSGRYRECLKIYKYKLYQTSNPRYLRAMGDCHRQLGQTKEALDCLGAALQICQRTKDDKLTAQILNSRGLAYLISKDLLPLASKDFIKATYKDITNPLYCCNASYAFLQNQDKFNQTQYCSRADYLLASLSPQIFHLSQSNLQWIQECINLFKYQQSKNRNIFPNKPGFCPKILEANISSKQLFKIMLYKYQLKQSCSKSQTHRLSQQQQEKIYEMYEGVSYYLNIYYAHHGDFVKSKYFPWNRFAKTYRPKDVLKTITEEMFLYPLPLCLQEEWKRNSYLSFGKRLQSSFLQLLVACRSDLTYINPDSFVDKLKNDFYSRTRFDFYPNTFEMYGGKLAYDLLFGFVATGEIYQGKIPTECTREELMQRLKSACNQIVRKDLFFQCGEEDPKY